MRIFRQTIRDDYGRTKPMKDWYIEVRIRGRQARIPGLPDREPTEVLGRTIERLVAHDKAGEPAPPDMEQLIAEMPERTYACLVRRGLLQPRPRVETRRPIDGLLEEFEQALLDQGNTAKHAQQHLTRVRGVLFGAGMCSWSDIDARGVERFLAAERERGMSASTSNHRLQAVRQFCRWAVKYGHAETDPLRAVRPVRAQGDRRYERRPLTEAELRRLVAAAEAAPARFDMTGPARSLCYRVAAETGLRAGEIRSLRASSFDGLDGPTPVVRLRAQCSKRRKADVLPLRAGTARAVAEYLRDLEPSWAPFPVYPRAAAMIRADLADAGISPQDGQGRWVDFHSLRMTMVTNLARANVPMRIAQTLARHSTPLLTFNTYSQLGSDEERRALNSLPDLDAEAGATKRRASEPDPRLHALNEQWGNLSAEMQDAVLRVAGVGG